MDGITLYAIRSEIAGYLPLKVQKVRQPAPGELVFSVWSDFLREDRLVVSMEGNRPFFGFSDEKKENPATPPGFCLGLRKRLEGGKLTGIRQHRMDRVLYLDFEGHDDLGNPAPFTLVYDVAGRGRNIGLYRGGVLEAAAVPPSGDRFQHARPYTPPEGQRLDLSVPHCREDIEKALTGAQTRKGEGDMPAIAALSAAIEGIGKDLAVSILTGAGADPDLPLGGRAAAVAEALEEISVSLAGARFHPVIYAGPKGQALFHVLLLRQYEVLETHDSVLAGLRASRLRETAAAGESSLRAYVESLHRKVLRKIESRFQAQSQDYARSQDYPKYKAWARLLDSGGVKTPPGLSEVNCLDYYRVPPVEVTVPLDPRYSARDNARNYWNRYAKLNRAQKVLEGSLAITRAEIARVARAQEMMEASLGHGGAADLERAASLLESLARKNGVAFRRPRGLAVRSAGHSARKDSASLGSPAPEAIEGADGAVYFVGGNARQNDYLVTKVRKPGDVWFHAKNAKGAHVLLRPPQGGSAAEEDIMAGAKLAAERSEARSSSKVEVDVVDASRIRKPRGDAPGFVTYTGQRTVLVSLR